MTGKTVCRLHGGKSLAGISSPTFKHGKNSKYFAHLPDGMAAHFHPDDPKLIELREELALVDAGVVELLDRQQAQKRVSAKARKELWDLVERRSRLVAVESRRRKDEHEMVERAEFGRFARAFLTAVATHIEDRALRAKIQDDALRILSISQVVLVAGDVPR